MKTRVLTLLGLLVFVLFGGGEMLSVFLNISFWHGVYCALAIGATDGCDVNAPSEGARWVEAIVIIISVPTIGALFALRTSAHIRKGIGKRLDQHRDEIKEIFNNNNGVNHVEDSTER